jgi:hypothetical protein
LPASAQVEKIEVEEAHLSAAHRLLEQAFPAQKESLWARMLKPLLSFYNAISGPPMSQHERFNREVAEVEARNKFIHLVVM